MRGGVDFVSAEVSWFQLSEAGEKSYRIGKKVAYPASVAALATNRPQVRANRPSRITFALIPYGPGNEPVLRKARFDRVYYRFQRYQQIHIHVIVWRCALPWIEARSF